MIVGIVGHLHCERFSTTTFALAVGIVECKFTGQLRLFPIHDSSNHIEERHRFYKDLDSLGFHFQILFWFFQGVIECV
jgi:hypothetical protein